MLFRNDGSDGLYRSHDPVRASYWYTIAIAFPIPPSASAGATSADGHATRFAPGESGSDDPGVCGFAVGVGVAALACVGVGVALRVGVAVAVGEAVVVGLLVAVALAVGEVVGVGVAGRGVAVGLGLVSTVAV
jgi:hypothetical protein